ncbi:hypothetical protein B0T24DRAFT_651645 [Lasiosphaeria ovina]|uniref:Short-chain dehydrogenase n=1 Tax=Lasiosphaeria ovina TaxID=92902 RepID=A0AAE0K139_9PEZI|nr:hypothetical protein B0T24DRAFT_651645 [Lasiosphaeria ovina]
MKARDESTRSWRSPLAPWRLRIQTARFFITGSSDGLGLATAKHLIAQGHQVVLHARNADRTKDATAACPGCDAVLVADLTSIDETKQLAAQADRHGPYDAVLHNAGLFVGFETVPGKSGLPSLFIVNTLTPYMLTCLWLAQRGWCVCARRWPDVQCYTAAPGWVPTKMGRESAPGRLEDAVDTFAMVALGEGPSKGRSGGYFEYSKEQQPIAVAEDVALQDRLLAELSRISGVPVREEQ